jgi:ApeA-like protein
MIEDVEYKGYWHITENPAYQIAGTLTFSADQGAHLNLIGSFHAYEDCERIPELPFILGTAHDGTRITLFRCFLGVCRLNRSHVSQNDLAHRFPPPITQFGAD